MIDMTNQDNESHNAENGMWNSEHQSAAAVSVALVPEDEESNGAGGGPRRRSQSHLLIVGDPGCG